MALVCCLCGAYINNVEFDLQTSVSLSSKTTLLTILRNCLVEEFLMNNYLICKMCYLLLNELDSIKLKMKMIEDKIKNYMCKYFTNITKIEEIYNKEEECTVCYKSIDTQHFKAHLKTHNIETNDLETNFDFDEVNSLSEINPSLEDVNLLNSDEIEEKNIKPKIHRPMEGIKNETGKKPNDSKPYSCTECSKTWKTLSELKNHISSHSNERPYVCEICGQAYKRQQALKIHVGMHNGINPFTCVYCKKSFTQKGALVRHTPIHTGEFPFQCDLCGKRFVHHTSFSIHKLSHSGEKPFKCEVCGLLLISGSHLKRHMRVHTGEKKFSCNTCGKKFAEKYNLAVHEKLHLGTSMKKYKCHVCDNVYNSPVKLEEHLLQVHTKIEYPE